MEELQFLWETNEGDYCKIRDDTAIAVGSPVEIAYLP